MVKKVMDGLFSSIYFWISIIILFCFFTATWHVNTRVEKQALDRVNTMTTDVAINNIQLISNMFDDYDTKLSFLKTSYSVTDSDAFSKLIEQIKENDSSIDSVFVESTLEKHIWQKATREVTITNGKAYLKYSIPIDTQHQICLLVNLISFHDKVADSKWLGTAYLTIICSDVYLYHPDESKIGQEIGVGDIGTEKNVLANLKDTIINTNSDYLNIPVYSYYSIQNINGEKWLFTANLPNLGISDSIRTTTTDLFIISLLAICSFILVFSLGIHRWRKEHTRRREFEKQNLNLLLSEEQYKQTIISTELERLKSGLNPHFLFNSLGSLRVLISRDAKVAEYFAITLSNVYRYMLKQENINLVYLKEELEFTQDYINLQKIRFSKKIITSIDIPEHYLEFKVLPISLQLLVENCIKHTCISDAEPLNIRIYVEGNLLIVVNNYNPRESEVEPSGKGIDNLVKRYSFITDVECVFEIVDNYYFAKIPIIL